MDDEKRIPKLLGEMDVLLAEHSIINQILDLALIDKDEGGVYYIEGVCEFADRLLKEIRGE